MIVDVLGWLAIADGVAALLLAAIVFLVARRSPHPVTVRSAIVVAVVVALPALLLYLIALSLIQLDARLLKLRS